MNPTESEAIAKAVMENLTGEKEDRICIARDIESGVLAWKFDTRYEDPISMIMRTLFYVFMQESGYKARIEKLEENKNALSSH